MISRLGWVCGAVLIAGVARAGVPAPPLQQAPCMVAAQSAPAPVVGPATVPPDYSAADGGPVPDSGPPCLPTRVMPQAAAPTAAPDPAVLRARAAQLAKRQQQIDQQTAQLLQLAQALRAAAMAQNANAVLSTTALRDAQQIARLAKQVQATLKAH